MSYKAIVSKIHVRPLPGADRLQIGSCGQYQVIVGIDVKDGELGAFMESDGQISSEFAAHNDLIRRKNEDGSPAGGMFEEHRRVKAIKLRGAKSEGFWCPIKSFEYTGATELLVEGFQFDELNGHPICNKYVTPATQARGAQRLIIRRQNKMFAKHFETGQFRRECNAIPADATCFITEKMHGSSFRLAHVLDETPIDRGVFSRVASWLGFAQTHMTWQYLIGTRNVILDKPKSFHNSNHHDYEEFRRKCVEGISLHKGECVYGEIVGFTETGTAIMSQKMGDKKLQQKYGNVMQYSYGCEPGACKIVVYRITQVNEDGYAVELSWVQVKKRCRELGIQTVPEVHWPVSMAHHTTGELCNIVAGLTEQADGSAYSSPADGSHFQEGVVVRWESEHGTGWLKSKAHGFLMAESSAKDSADYVDAEEAA